MVVAAVPKTMSTKFAFVVNSLRRCFHKYALDINWKAGKTEGILMWRGKRARTEKLKLRKANGRQTFPVGRKRRRHRRKSASDGLDQAVDVGIVKQYKHLGGIIEENGSMFPEVRNRCKSAMNSLAPLGALLGSRHVSLRPRVNLTHSLIVSKLLYNSQTWENLEKRQKQSLNTMYMRAWRRVANDPRYRRTKFTDVAVRQMLQVASLDCALRRRRLLYFSRLTRVALEPLHAVLQQRTPAGELLLWVKLFFQDLDVLRAHLPGKLAEMPSPWWVLARTYPGEWKSLVKSHFAVYDDTHYQPDAQGPRGKRHHADPCATVKFECAVCKVSFETHRQLSTHMWSKHRMKSSVRRMVGDISRCPVCGVEFGCLARLAKHLLERRVRSAARGKSCQEEFLALELPRVSDEVYRQLEERDAALTKAARAAGHTSLIADEPARQTRPSILKKTRVHGPVASDPPPAIQTEEARRRRSQRVVPISFSFRGLLFHILCTAP